MYRFGPHRQRWARDRSRWFGERICLDLLWWWSWLVLRLAGAMRVGLHTSLGEESAESLIWIRGLALFGQVSIWLFERMPLAKGGFLHRMARC